MSAAPPVNRDALVAIIRAARNEATASVMRRAGDKDLQEFVASLRRSGLVTASEPAAPESPRASPPPETPMPYSKPSAVPSPGADLSERQRQALAFIDKAIQPMNREVIHRAIPGLGKEKYVEFAAVVAQLRADYLATALTYFVGQRQHTATKAGLAQLREMRETYEEALHAYDALHRALERGYVDPVD
jgi:hypothetical protein